MRQPHERLAHQIGRLLGRTDLKLVLTASLAVYSGIGWVHDKFRALDALETLTAELDARQSAAAAREAQLHAEVRELRIELHYAEVKPMKIQRDGENE